ncbi:MAG TPA: DUF4349 domain-containing protein [Anaerolineales bacterium]|nr:DUF4349 domain-containing protein [Anaerolineales bacterium]
MKKVIALSLLIPALLLASCSTRGPASSAPLIYGEPGIGFVGGEAAAEMEAPQAAPDLARQAQPSSASDVDRLVIQTASLSIVVTDPVAEAAAIRRLVEGMGGYVVSSYIYKSAYGDGLTADNASISVRVPAERLTEALEQMKADAVEVRSENITGEDVTAQYVDLESRLRNLEAAEAQLMKIMDSADETEDVLAVYNQLVSVRGEIEMVRGQMQYYEESAAFSLITAELIPDAAAQPIEIGGWRPEGTVKAAVEALIQALQSLADAAIWLAICVLPVALLVGLPVLLIVRAARRRRAKAGAKG